MEKSPTFTYLTKGNTWKHFSADPEKQKAAQGEYAGPQSKKQDILYFHTDIFAFWSL